MFVDDIEADEDKVLRLEIMGNSNGLDLFEMMATEPGGIRHWWTLSG